MLPSLAYSETDTDFHVCPLPRFTATDGDDISQSATQKQYLDRQVGSVYIVTIGTSLSSVLYMLLRQLTLDNFCYITALCHVCRVVN